MINALVYFVIYIVVLGLIIGLLLWLIDQVPIPEPFHRVARIAIIVIGVLIVILLLLSVIGEGPPRFRLGAFPSGSIAALSTGAAVDLS